MEGRVSSEIQVLRCLGLVLTTSELYLYFWWGNKPSVHMLHFKTTKLRVLWSPHTVLSKYGLTNPISRQIFPLKEYRHIQMRFCRCSLRTECIFCISIFQELITWSKSVWLQGKKRGFALLSFIGWAAWKGPKLNVNVSGLRENEQGLI